MSHHSGKRKRGEPTTDYPSYEIEDSPEPESARSQKRAREDTFYTAVAREYTYHRAHGLTKAQAKLASNMAFTKKKPGKKPQGIGARAKAKNSYKNGGISDKALQAAVRKVEAKSLETFYVNWGINYYTGLAQATNTFQPGGFQAIAGSAANSSGGSQMGGNFQVMNLSPQIQVGTSAGYRRGQFVNPLGLKMCYGGHMSNYCGDHTFNVIVARYKGNGLLVTGVYPAPVAATTLGLYEVGAFGPNSGSYSLANDGTSIDLGRYNRDVWDIKKRWSWKVAYEKTAEVAYKPQTTFRKDMYYKFPAGQQWDYTAYTQTVSGLTIKGGDYYVIMYQVGNEASTTADHSFQLNCELSYKDA